MSIADTWSEDAFVRLMQDLIGSEGGLYAADNDSEREPTTAPTDNDAGSVVASQGRQRTHACVSQPVALRSA